MTRSSNWIGRGAPTSALREAVDGRDKPGHDGEGDRDIVVGVGNTTGAEVDKFEKFGLTAQPGSRVKVPLIGECHAGFECRLADDALVDKCNVFVFEVVKAHVAPSPKHPETLHYTGDGVFMVSGKIISRRKMFRPELLDID